MSQWDWRDYARPTDAQTKIRHVRLYDARATHGPTDLCPPGFDRSLSDELVASYQRPPDQGIQANDMPLLAPPRWPN